MRLRVFATAALAASVLLGEPGSTSEPTQRTPAEPTEEAAPPGTEAPGPESARGEVQAAVASKPPAPVYRLPKVGKPRRRIGGGRRGPAEGLPSLTALAPDHVGLTSVTSPTLVWYAHEVLSASARMKLVLIDSQSIDPLLDVSIEPPASGGFQRTQLADYGLELVIGEQYQWSIELVVDPDHPSRNVVATAWVERVAPPADLAEALVAAGPDGSSAAYAGAGLWYDALAASLDLAESAPTRRGHDAPLRALLSQADLEFPRDASGAP